MSKKLITVSLGGDPYAAELYCPYCGEQILEPEGENTGECPHLVHADMEEPDEEAIEANDLCFMFFEAAPASRYHYFVFREVSAALDEEDA